MEEKSQPTAAPSDAPPLSGSFEGLHEAAQELKLQRDEDDAPIEVVEVPNLEDKVSIRDGAKKLTDWRQERDAERAAFDRAVFGDSPVAEDSAVETITAPADAPELLERMYDEFILARASAKKPSTQKLYTGAFKHFHEWCADAGASALPARIGTVGSYLHEEIVAGASPEKIRCIVAAISWAHKIKPKADELPLGDPTEDELIKAIVHSTTVNGRKLNGGKVLHVEAGPMQG